MVLLIFDEIPVDDLLRPDGRIDAERFPNFAKLASTSTWFRSGTTIYDSTTKAVPAILDARVPRKGTVPGPEGHPSNVFTLFDSLGYGIEAAESVTSLCPTSICASSTPAAGVIDRVAPQGEHLAQAYALAKQIAANPPLSVRATVRTRRWYMDQAEREAYLQTNPLKLHLTEDFKESARAFAEKRKPGPFKGQ